MDLAAAQAMGHCSAGASVGAQKSRSRGIGARVSIISSPILTDVVSYPGGDVKYDPDVSTYRGSLIYRF